MSLTATDVKKIAHLARLNMSEQEITTFTQELSGILDFVEQMNQAQTDNLQPLAHSLDVAQRVRQDEVTETDRRSAYQAIAPLVEAGLYMVPQVIEGGE